ncbi:MAG: hypothetical protein H0T44_00615 [Gemmatimonadales bacterium]|nr:hypothetical protein [Gemmatimonadales bacterium]
MTLRSPAATNAARRLWPRRPGDVSDPEEVAAAANRVCVQLRSGLARWVGSEGYRALLDRALGESAAHHPVLSSLSCHEGDEQAAVAAVRAYGSAEVAAGMVALVATLIDLLGRIIGEEMAVRLVEQSATPGPRRVSSTDRQGGRNG